MDTYRDKLLIRRAALASVVAGGFFYLYLGLQNNKTNLASLLYLVVGIAALYLAIQKETWFPQNGPLLLPLNESFKTIEGDTKSLSIDHPHFDDLKGIIYWQKGGKESYYVAADKDKDTIEIKVPNTKKVTMYRLVFANGLIGKVNEIS